MMMKWKYSFSRYESWHSVLIASTRLATQRARNKSLFELRLPSSSNVHVRLFSRVGNLFSNSGFLPT